MQENKTIENTTNINANLVSLMKDTSWRRDCIKEILSTAIRTDDRLNTKDHVIAGDFAVAYFIFKHKRLQSKRHLDYLKRRPELIKRRKLAKSDQLILPDF